MKFTKFFMAIAAVAMIAACDKTEQGSGNGEWTETAPEFTAEIAEIVVTEETLDNKVSFSFSKADFGIATQINYAIEVQLGEGPKEVVLTTTKTTVEATLAQINVPLYKKLGATTGEPIDVNFYVSAQMGESEKLYSQVKTVKVTVIEYGAVKSEWGLVGTINGWGGTPDLTMFEADAYFAAYNIALTTTDEFKIRANQEWNDEKNYGTEVKGTFAPNTKFPVITSGGSQNIGVKEAGLYDIYFDLENKMVYLMTAGKTPDQAGEAGVEYVDPSADSFNVGFSGSALGWDDPAFDTNDRAAFKTKNVTDATTFAGSYTYELAAVTFAAGDEFKVRVNGAWVGAGEGGAVVEGLSVSGEDNFIAGEAGTFKATITFDWDGLQWSNVKVVFAK